MSQQVATTRDQPELLAGFSGLADSTDVLICDVWGVVHNGQHAHPAACAALQRFRAAGGTVVMVSNSPRPSVDVIPQMMGFGVPRDVFDAIVTSGDVTRGLIQGRGGQPALHLGPDRDHTLFKGLDMTLVGLEDAAYCICTGFSDDERETPEDYAATLARMAERGLVMICANPDLIVERGDRLIPCAGAMALAYEKRGGHAIYAGKPHRPVYERAIALALDIRGGPSDLSRVRAVGDALRTDVAGANAFGIEAILLFEGIHWADVGGPDWLRGYGPWLANQDAMPRYVMPRLSW